MGRETKNFRQTKRAGGADASYKAYAKSNRMGPYNKVNITNMNKEVTKDGQG